MVQKDSVAKFQKQHVAKGKGTAVLVVSWEYQKALYEAFWYEDTQQSLLKHPETSQTTFILGFFLFKKND